MVIIVPVYAETALIASTIGYLRDQLRGLSNILVVIVGNAKERDGNGRNPTLELAKACGATKNPFSLMEFPGIDGMKAHQLNYAIRQGEWDLDETWVGIFDIDSRFSRRGLEEALNHINRGTPVFQQHAAFLSNLRSLPLLQQCQALWQTRWTIRHEITRLRYASISGWLPAHVVGHGLFINLKVLREIGGFPEEALVEDVALGYSLLSCGYSVASLRTLELADTPVTFSEGLRQIYTWSCGPLNYPAYYRHFKRKLPHIWKIRRRSAAIMAALGIARHTNWLVTSWVVMFVVASAVHYTALAIAWICLYLIECFQVVVFAYNQGWLLKKDLYRAPLKMLMFTFWTSIPADVSFLRAVLCLGNKKFKTRHL